MGRLRAIRRFGQSFTGRLIIGLLLTQILLAPLLFFGILHFIERGLQSQFVDEVRNNTHLYAALMKPAIRDGDIAKQEAVLDEAFLGEDLLLAEFIRPDGTVIRPASALAPDKFKFREDFGYGEHGDNVYYIASDVRSDTGRTLLGTLRLGFNERPTQSRIADAYRYGALLTLGYAGFSVLIAIFFGRRLSQPLSRLQAIARSVASGDTATDLAVKTKVREISRLSEDLDNMRRTLLRRNRALEDREKRLSGILDNAGEGIISTHSDGVIVSFNRAAETIFGYRADEVVGKNVAILIASQDAGDHDAYLRYYQATGETRIVGAGRRVEVRHADGHLFPVYLKVTEIELDKEHLFIGMVRDLTDEEKKDKQLLQFWRVVEQSPISIVITDTAGLIEYVNPKFCQITGYSEEEVHGVNPNILRPDNIDADVYTELWETIARGDIWRGEFQNKKKNGEVFWESATICPVQDQNGRITHYVALKENITEHRQKDRMLDQAMKLEAVGRMTDGIAHDFNNLLTIILGNLQYLKEDYSTLGRLEIMELVADAMSAAYDGANLIKQLLIFSRRQEQAARPMELSAFMERVYYLLNRTVPADIDLRLDVAGDVGSVLIDSNRLESAILNLVINARDAMPDGGDLVISIDAREIETPENVEGGQIDPGSYIFISVADNGTGMTEAVRRQALEPFFTTKPSATGTGLGLSMVHDLMLKSGGGIRIESEEGKGTVVTLILPRNEPAFEPRQVEEEEFGHLPRGHETVLIVEDQDKVRRYAKRVLSALGYRVLEAGNAAQAIGHLDAEAGIDLLFSDIVMPGGMDGRQLAQHAIARRPSLKILLTTGMDLRARSEGGPRDEFPLIDKPYSIEKLAQSIRNVLNAA